MRILGGLVVEIHLDDLLEDICIYIIIAKNCIV